MQHLAINGGTPVWAKGWPKWPIFGAHEEENLHNVLESGTGPMTARLRKRFSNHSPKCIPRDMRLQ